MAKYEAYISWRGKANKVHVSDPRYPIPFDIPTLGSLKVQIEADDRADAIKKLDALAATFNDRAQLDIETLVKC